MHSQNQITQQSRQLSCSTVAMRITTEGNVEFIKSLYLEYMETNGRTSRVSEEINWEDKDASICSQK